MTNYINRIIQLTRQNPEPTPERLALIEEALKAGVDADVMRFAIDINTPDPDRGGRTISDELGDALRDGLRENGIIG